MSGLGANGATNGHAALGGSNCNGRPHDGRSSGYSSAGNGRGGGSTPSPTFNGTNGAAPTHQAVATPIQAYANGANPQVLFVLLFVFLSIISCIRKTIQ